MSYIFHQLFFDPLYNLLVWLSAVLPGHSLGLSIIIVTIIVKLILLPLYHKTTTAQQKIKALEPKLKELKEKHANNREEQARQTMALYRDHGINPLTSFWLLLVQIPIVLALFWVFRDSFDIRPELLYSFVTPPSAVNATLFGLDLTARNYVLAILVGASQFLQMRLAIPAVAPVNSQDRSFKTDFARSMNVQMRYIMPAFITLVSFGFPAALTLYWLTSNLFAIGHELVVRHQAKELVVR
ncbi:MAG: YidC/Oxa1 family membrane protein insertase [Patescibacteria group bacterium]